MPACLTPPSTARRRQGGWSLVEISLALALAAVLLVVALPAYMSYRETLRQRVAAQDIAAMGAVIQQSWEDAHAYPANLAAVQLATRKDPWGRAYVYYNVDANGRGGARKDHALNPINTDFDLYSLGPDGVSASQVTQKDSLDDVIRANNGAFVGRAADF